MFFILCVWILIDYISQYGLGYAAVKNYCIFCKFPATEISAPQPVFPTAALIFFIILYKVDSISSSSSLPASV